MATYLEQSLAKLEEFEGAIPWMYLDTVGKVTVGCGLMLPDVQAAQRLPFQQSGRPATAVEIAQAFARVDAMPMGRAALFYRAKDGPELTRPEMDALLSTVVAGFEGELRAHLPAYDSFPGDVKLALIDMIYNLGSAGLFHSFPRFIAAVQAQNWAQAAALCYRHGPGAARNAWTRSMFLASVVGTIKASAESGWKRLGFGLLGLGVAAFERIRKPQQ